MANTAAFRVETAVIGAGVVGLAVARCLAQAGKEVLLLEKEKLIASETSSRNSEVIHGGLYYPPNSLKAKFCVQGKQLLYDYCKSRNIPFSNCGKIIVATNHVQHKINIPILYNAAIQNGVDDVKVLTQDDVHFLEPQITSQGGLLSPSTGVLDSHSYYLSLLADAEYNGATFAANVCVQDAKIQGSENEIYLFADDTWIQCQSVVNCAGLWATEVAKLIHSQTKEKADTTNRYWRQQYFAKGTYFRLQHGNASTLSSSAVPFQHLIYPIPEPGGLGIHATIDWNRTSVKFGPNVQWLDPKTHPSQFDYNPYPDCTSKFYGEIQKYYPQINKMKIHPDYVGIRPKLVHPDIMNNDTTHQFADFNITGPKDHGIDGLVHLFGIESPGLTSSMAIAKRVTEIIVGRSDGIAP